MVDYAELAKNILSDKFPLFGGFRREVDYQEMGPPGYDPETGIVTDNLISEHKLFVIAMGFSFTKTNSQLRQVDDESILDIDKKMIFPAKDLPIVPSVRDRVIIEGITWRIIAINDDPAPAHYNLHIRPIDE